MTEPRSETDVIEKYKQMRQELGALSEKINELESKVRRHTTGQAFAVPPCKCAPAAEQYLTQTDSVCETAMCGLRRYLQMVYGTFRT